LCVFPACGGDDSPIEPDPVCTFAINPATSSFSSESGNGSVAVTAAAGCAWTATANASWLAITSGTPGSGNGTVAFSVQSQNAADARTGTLTIAGQTHTVTQQGRPPVACRYEISPGRATHSKDAATGTFAVTAPNGCAWTATSTASWLSVTSGAQGSGAGTVAYAVSRHTDPVTRTAEIRVSDQRFTVEQSGDVGVCEYSVSPVQSNPCMPAGTLTATLTTSSGCGWTVESNASWLTVTSSRTGTGSSTITASFAENYDAPRNGIVMVRWPTASAGQNIHVAQAGCTYALSRSDISVAAAGGSGSFDVFQQAVPNTCGGALQDRCIWTPRADVPWITVPTTPRSGDNAVTFSVAPNDATTSRVGRITVRDKTMTITQAGR
jgi:hypothetical protein